jgi:hypothetical protein
MSFLLYFGLTEEQLSETGYEDKTFETILTEITAKDPTFEWKSFKAKYGEHPELKKPVIKIFQIACRTYKQAHRRGVWLVNKTQIPKLLYWVKHKK